MRHRPLVSNSGAAQHSGHVPPTEHPLLPSCNGAPTTGSMIVQVLGCSGSIAAGCRTTSFLLDDDVLIDAGTGVGDMPLDALARVEHILISHSHLDHILAIGLLADSVMRERSAADRGPIQVHALPETIAALRTHIFNGVIWPDFTRLPSADKPMLALVPIYTGDTGPNPKLWERLATMRVAHLVIETAFGDDERQLARISRHLCPAALGHELAHLAGSIDVHITHIKPGERAAVMAEIGRLGSQHKIRALEIGDVMRFVDEPKRAYG